MDMPSFIKGAEVQRYSRSPLFLGRSLALILLGLVALPALAARVPVRDGQTVPLKLRNVLTTDNCRKNDVIEFDVADDVMVNGHVVIAKGATARAKITDIKGAFKPKDKGAEVVFKFETVSAVDRQELPLRIPSEKSQKGKQEEIHEKSSIPGQISRVVGADKGKEYTVYVDGAFTIGTSDAIVAAPDVTPAAPTPEPVAPATPVAVTPAPASPLAATDEALAPSSVEFDSTPDGADIANDGNMVGNTPSTLRLIPGHHSIEIRMAGYRTWTRVMVVDPESHPSVRATLIKLQ